MSKSIREFWIQINADPNDINKPYKRYVSANPFGGVGKNDEDYPNAEIVHVVDFESYQRLLDANKNLEKIIAKELSENDEFGAEFVHVNILKQEIIKLKDANKKLREVVSEENLLKVIREWKHVWMNQKQNSEADYENYLRRASGVDANMVHSLARRIAAEASKIEGGS